MELNFYDQERGFHIDRMCSALADAMEKDDSLFPAPDIKKLLQEAMDKNNAKAHGDYLPEEVAFLVFADLMYAIGCELGYQLEKDDFALIWADDYTHLNKVCAMVTHAVVTFLCKKSAQIEAANGFSLEEVLIRTLERGISPEQAAAELAQERIKPLFH